MNENISINKKQKISISLDPLVKTDFNNAKGKTTSEEFITELLQCYNLNQTLKSFENEKLKQVRMIKNLTNSQIIQEALIDYINKVFKADKKGLTGHLKSTKADEYIDKIIKDIIIHNENNDKNNQIYINQSAIYKWIVQHQLSLVNVNVIKRYLRLHKNLLNEHHLKYNLTILHNRQAFIKRRFGNEQAEN